MKQLNDKYIIRDDIEKVTEFLEACIPVLHPDDESWRRIIERFHLALND